MLNLRYQENFQAQETSSYQCYQNSYLIKSKNANFLFLDSASQHIIKMLMITNES